MKKIKNIFLTATHLLIGSVCFAQDNLPVSGQIAGYDYVDLGLPSGTLWATYNVGATKPTEYGDYFAWGETEPKEVYADSTYKWFNADSKIFTKYNSEDGLKTLLPEDDAATANWGSEWRMPTNEEQRELVEECQYQMTEVNGVYGAKFTGKNGNSVFFPAAVYWSSSLREKDEDYARDLGFGEKNVYWGEGDRGNGFSVRAVANKTTDIEEYVVSFYTQDSVLIESQKVEKGKSATAVDAPVVDGYEFIGWSDSSFTNVMKDLDIYAQYKAITKDTLPVSGQIAEHDYVDLGLPSGTKWATCNVGATKPTESGDYFAWGETEPKEVYNWDTYKYGVGSGFDVDSITKYNMSEKYGIIDSLSTLLPEDDAATANWGKEWRMPTNEEQRELYENSYMVWTDGYNGTDVIGVIFYKAKSAEDKGEFVARWQTPSSDYSVSDDAHVFLPHDGGYYWSSSLNEDDEVYALYLYIITKGVGWDGRFLKRVSGYPVRAVANKTTDIEEYVVSFYTQDSVLIESQKVEKGKSATAVDAPVVDGYEFIGWSDSSFTNVMKDLDIYAQYKAITKDTLPVSGQIAEHDYVDLGLPSGTLWATYNVGATKPEQYGYYFAWGETEPKEDYSWSTYKWCKGSYDSMTKYCTDSDHGTVDNKTVLEAADDAATANWGSAWRMPTKAEQDELRKSCDWEWTDDFNGTGVAGQVGTSTANGNKIFLPAAGFRFGTDLSYAGGSGSCLSSSLGEDYSLDAYDLYFYDIYIDWGNSYRNYGRSVRAVANKTTEIEEYVVSFYTQDSVLIESQKVEKGKSATAVDAPVVDGYEFIGWSDSSFTNVMKDLDIYAQYKAITKDTLPVSGQIAGYDYIDLGLPSGTLWATCNVGATTPTGYGHHFAWGETETKKVYDWSTYKWCEGSKNSLTKYFDKKMELDSEDDAAMVNWGKEWRMPTSEEQGELLENCYMVWTTNYLGTDVAGVIFYKAKDEKDKGEYIAEWRQRDLSASYNAAYDAHIFLPAAGGRWENDNNRGGYYWSSSLSLEYDKHYHASFLGFAGKDFEHDEPYYCIYGFSVRAVANGTSTSASTISNHALLVYADNSTIHVVNAQPNTNIQVFDMSGKAVASGTTDANGNVEISLSTSKGVYVVTDGSQSTKVILK